MVGRRWRGVIGVGACVLAGALMVGSRASADDESDRAGYLSDISSNLGDAASRLSSVASASDDGYLRAAEGHIDKVRELVARLNDKKPGDERGRAVVERYPRYISDFQDAAKELRALKARQPAAAALAQQCKAFDVSMTERAKAAKDDPRGAEELSDFAKSVGRKAEEMLRDAERTKSDVERSASDVRRFSAGDDRWPAVRDAAHRAADDMARAWVSAYDQARRDCAEVVKRERHRDVERALGELAGSRAGRADLRNNIDRMLALIAQKVTDVQSHSSPSEANGAVEITKQLESLLERLRYAQGEDPETRAIASSWPGWTRDLRTSLEALRDLKASQHRADGGVDRCKEAERKLQDDLRAWVGDPTKHREGIAQLPPRARQLGAEWKTKIEAAQETDRYIAGLYATARRFSQSDGPWSQVTRQLHSSADRVTEHWRSRYTAAMAACAALALGEANPDVQKAMAEMQRGTSEAANNYRELRTELHRWKAEVDTLRDWSRQDVEEIRRAFCQAPDAGDYQEVNAVANRWASKLNDLWGSITGQGERIKARATELVRKGRAQVNGPKVVAGVDAILASIQKVKDHQLQGSNNPLLKAFADYGVQEHERRQSKCGSNREIPISGSYCTNPHPGRRDCKMDCVLVSNKVCTIVEIKPREAETLGKRQADAYVEGIRRLFAALGPSGFTDKLSVFRECVSDDGRSVNVRAELELYDFCTRSEPLGAASADVRVDVPEEEQ